MNGSYSMKLQDLSSKVMGPESWQSASVHLGRTLHTMDISTLFSIAALRNLSSSLILAKRTPQYTQEGRRGTALIVVSAGQCS